MAEKTEAPVQNPMESCQGTSGFLFILAFGFLFLIMFNRELGDSIAELVGLFLEPIIGFGGSYPLLTMFCSGILTIAISTTIRHFTMDWVDMAKKQNTMKDFNKQMNQARKDGNQSKLEKLQEENQDIMGLQSSMMMQQMKSSVISMVIAILIFRWLYSFIWAVPQPTITTPWDYHFPLTGSAFKEVCGSICMNPQGGGMPYWIFIYIPITVPIGQALMRGFKYFEFSRKLRKEGLPVFGALKELAEPGELEEPPKHKESEKKDKKKRYRNKGEGSDKGNDSGKGGNKGKGGGKGKGSGKKKMKKKK